MGYKHDNKRHTDHVNMKQNEIEIGNIDSCETIKCDKNELQMQALALTMNRTTVCRSKCNKSNSLIAAKLFGFRIAQALFPIKRILMSIALYTSQRACASAAAAVAA